MRMVGDDYVLKAGDTLEFLDPRGAKGTGRFYRSESEIMEAFGLTETRYKEWLDRGLPVYSHDDGTVVMTEDAFDCWFRSITGVGDSSETDVEGRSASAESNTGLILRREAFAVEYRGRTCMLGNSITYRLLVLLIEARGTFVSYRDLVSEVWREYPVCNSTIHQAVRSLRAKLRTAGMTDVEIVAERGHYALRTR